ncbi:MAG: TetR/AcrR family transcriptional regulator [bacterium]
MPKKVDETKRKNEIAKAAARVFAENGFRQTSVQEIAEEAEMSKGSLYHFMDSKKQILNRIFVRFENQLHEAIDECFERTDDPVGQLKTLSVNVFSLLKNNEPTLKVIFDFWSYSLHNTDQDILDFESFYKRIEQKLEAILENGREQDIFRDDINENLSSILIGYIEGQLVQWQINPSRPPIEPAGDNGIYVIIEGLLKDNLDL